jgi:AraC-like DNA-binding protein
MSADPISSVLSLTRARAVSAGGFTAGETWGLRFPPPHKIKVFVMARGECLVKVDGLETAYELKEGDVLLLRGRQGYAIASDLQTPLLDALEVFDPDRPGVLDLGGDAALFLGGHIDLDGVSGDLLFDHLPLALHIPADPTGPGRLAWLLSRLVEEQMEAAPGGDQASAAIIQLMFVEVLRVYLATGDDLPPGWLRALGDVRLGQALRSIHDEPARDWTVESLARACGMSRTAFAVRFRAVSGQSPLSYLTDWRMRIARHGLRDGVPIATLATSVGYASEAAFSTAFKRVSGMAPTTYRTMARQLPASDGHDGPVRFAA